MGSKSKRNPGRRNTAARGHWNRQSVVPDDFSVNGAVRAALENGGVVGVLHIVSMMLSLNDPRPAELFDRSKRSTWAPKARAELISAILADPAPEASVLLAVLASFLGDEDELTSQVRASLVDRPSLRPKWLERLDQTRISRAVRVTHPLDEFDYLLLEGRVPAANGEFTCVVELDVQGEAVRGAVLTTEPIQQLLNTSGFNGADMRVEDVELADVRARLTAAIRSESYLPPTESETWPRHRSLVEWLIRGLPDGGSALPRPELGDLDAGAIAEKFLGTTQGGLFGRRHRDLLVSLIEFGVERGAGDPFRWNVRRAKEWLLDYVVDDCPDYWDGRETAPILLRAFIRVVHDEVGIRSELTEDVLAQIDSCEPLFQKLLRDGAENDWDDVAVSNG